MTSPVRHRRIRQSLSIALAVLLAACGKADDAALDIAIIGNGDAMLTEGVRLSSAAQHLRAATREGLVGLDENGAILPALADRWIVTDDGRSYIFRLRDGAWPDGSELTGESARDAMRRAIRSLRGTSLGLDLAPIEEIRAMAGRVVELRLSSPTPDMLQLLAQPELGLKHGEGETGPLALDRPEDGKPMAVLSYLPPERRGLPAQPGWQSGVRLLRIDTLAANRAIEDFYAGRYDLVINGQMQSFPLLDTGPLSRGTVRLDGAIGLFGLRALNDKGVLASPYLREALAMALNRPGLVAAFNVGGWAPTTRVVPGDLTDEGQVLPERWPAMSLQQRRAEAARRISDWRRGAGAKEPPTVRIAMPNGPGADIFYQRIANNLAAIGVRSQRVAAEAAADLRLVDRLARYAAPRWFLNQFNCALRDGLCSEQADSMVAESVKESDPASRSVLLDDAEIELTAANIFIPIASPLRWSLVRGNVTGYAPNRWAIHPLPPLATVPR